MKLVFVLSLAAVLCALPAMAGRPKEGGKVSNRANIGDVQYTNEDYKRLDTFEAHRLTKADQIYAKGEYKQAYAEYDAFLLEFPKSQALAYALLRKARCLHLQNKRFEAIKAYQEVLEYFPNAATYAAPALYFIGLCHWENGSEDKAVSSWAKMAADREYSQHALGASAFNELGDYLWKQDKTEPAAQYHEQVATIFRTSNRDAANYAIGRVIEYYVRVKPDEPALRAFYAKVKTFAREPQAISGEVGANRDYWSQVQNAVRQFQGVFGANQESLRDNCLRYWTEAMAGKFGDWDDFQLNVIELQLALEKDTKKWMERLDNLFSKNQKPGDLDRIIRWIRVYREHKNKVAEYYNKLDLAKMTPEQIIHLMQIAYDEIQDATLGQSLFGRLPFDRMSDDAKVALAKFFAKRVFDKAKDLCMMCQDKERGKMELLRLYAGTKNDKEGLPLAEEMAKAPTYSQEALRIKADMLYASKQYEKAIAAYQQCDNPPANLWKIADCYAALGKLENALGQLREVENFFRQHSAEAALRIAGMYKRFGQRDQQIAALRNVLKKYPKSNQSSSAHQELEALGVRIGGGVDGNE